MDQASLKANLQATLAHAVTPTTATALATLARPSIRLASQRADEQQLPLGASKLGGMPDLAPNTAWPERDGVPLAFVAQVRLADVAPFDVAHLLPPDGLLSFFYDAHQETYGDDPADRGGWQVLCSPPGTTALQRYATPASLPEEAHFTACALSATTEWTLPQDPHLETASWQWAPGEQDRYEDLLARFPEGADRAQPRHRMLGYADVIQDDMRLQCQLAAHGVKLGTRDAQTAALAAGANNWLLLLQVDSDDRAGMHWGSAGMLYFWIERDALAAGRYDNVWLVLQSD